MPERPIEIIARAIAADEPQEVARLLAAAGLAAGLADFARAAAAGLDDAAEVAEIGARAAWLDGDAGAAAALWRETLESGRDGHERLFAAAQAEWLAGDLARALELIEAAIADYAAQDARELPGERRLGWFAGYLRALLGAPDKADNYGHSALQTRWSAAPPDERPVLAIFDYKAPDILAVSDNIGDFIQTAAALRHIARLDSVDWSYDDDALAEPMARLAASWPEKARTPVKAVAHLAIIDRDDPFSLALRLAGRPVWTIHNGWFFHKQFGRRRAMPGPENLYPLLVSFHLWRPSDLTPDLLDWLRTHQPVGCRDKVTMRWLLNQGIDAFFSGCLTLTLANERKVGKRSGDYDVDLNGDTAEGRIAIEHKMPPTRTQPLAQSLGQAIDLLGRYAHAASIRTSRLHCALPAWALGAPVEFRLPNAADRRFDGLVDADRKQRSQLRADMVRNLGVVIKQIALGKSPETVRGKWAELWRSRVDEARAELFDGKAPPGRSPALPAVRDAASPDPVTIVMAFDRNYLDKAKTVLRSVRENSMVPIRLVLLVRELGEADVAPIVDIVEPVETRILAMDGRMDGVEVELLQKITISTMDRLFVDELLPDLDRVVYLDCDIIVNSDIGELARFAPGPAGIAARPTPNPNVATIAEMTERRAMQMGEAEARALRVYAARSLDLLQRGFNAGILVLSLDTLRENGLMRRAIDLARDFGVHDQDALNLAATHGFATLPDHWNAMPHVDFDPAPSIIHWVGARKPWMKPPVRHKEFWRRYADAPAIGKAHWRKAESYRPDWEDRAKAAAGWIAPGEAVLDIGAGALLALGKHLPEGCRYQPADLRAWTDEVIAIDLDDGDFPDGEYDVIAMLGVFEYLRDPADVCERAARHADRLVTSFCHPRPDHDPTVRRARGWINAHGERQFAAMLNQAGWRTAETKLLKENENIREMLYRCEKAE